MTRRRGRVLRGLLATALALGVGLAAAQAPASGGLASLRARHAELAPRLAASHFGRPLVLDSVETSNNVRGEALAVLDIPYASLSAGLGSASRWCEVMMLHLNTKYCRVQGNDAAPVLQMAIGKKYDQPLDQAYRVDFAWRQLASSPDYLEIALNADSDPMGTNNYRIQLRAMPLEGNRSVLQFSYAYGFGTLGRMAMQVYLATVGSGKVGFTVTGNRSDGTPEFISGMRGVVERNTMRYCLAIEAYLNAGSGSPAEVLERRLQAWFAGTERYPRQLREMDQGSYLTMKRSEFRRLQQPL